MSPKKEVILVTNFHREEPTLYGQNDSLYQDQGTWIFIVNTHWYCSIIHLKVSKKNLKEDIVLGLMETVNLWFSLWHVGVPTSGEFKYPAYRGNEGSPEKLF